MQKVIVRLIRGPLPTREYLEANMQRALRRTKMLADLHSCVWVARGDEIIIDASAYYSPTPARLRKRFC